MAALTAKLPLCGRAQGTWARASQGPKRRRQPCPASPLLV